MICDRVNVIIKYNRATKVHTSSERKLVATKFFEISVKSITDITETSDESLINMINWEAIGGNTLRKACGKIISLIACAEVIPEERAASICPLGTDCIPALTISAIKAPENVARPSIADQYGPSLKKLLRTKNIQNNSTRRGTPLIISTYAVAKKETNLFREILNNPIKIPIGILKSRANAEISSVSHIPSRKRGRLFGITLQSV